MPDTTYTQAPAIQTASDTLPLHQHDEEMLHATSRSATSTPPSSPFRKCRCRRPKERPVRRSLIVSATTTTLRECCSSASSLSRGAFLRRGIISAFISRPSSVPPDCYSRATLKTPTPHCAVPLSCSFRPGSPLASFITTTSPKTIGRSSTPLATPISSWPSPAA